MNLILSVLHVSVVGIAARKLGSLFLLRLKLENTALKSCYETALGLGFFSYLLFIAAALNLISPALFSVLWAVSFFVFWELTNFFKIFELNKKQALAAGGIFLYLGGILLASSLPASDRDELIYQLEVPRQMLKTGGLWFSADNFYTFFPQFQNLLMLWGLGTAGETAAKLYHTMSGVLTGLALYAAGHRLLKNSSRFWALAIFFTVPSVLVLMPLAYVDLSFTFYSFLAYLALLQFHRESQMKWAVMAGGMAGFSAAVKFTGIQYTLLLVILSLGLSLRENNRKKITGAFVMAGTSFLCALPYLLRNYVQTGWPLYPFPSPLPLNAAMNWDLERAQFYLGWLGQFGSRLGAPSFFDSFAAPFLVFIRAQFNRPEFYEGVLGPVFLLIPVLLWKKEKPFEIKAGIYFSLLFLYYWAFTTKQVRFLIPVLPVLCLLLAYGLEKSAGYWKKITALFLITGLGLGIRELGTRDPLPFWQGKESREAYLSRQILQYPVYQETARILGQADKVLLINMKNYGYYLDARWTGDFVFERARLDRVLTLRSEAALEAFFIENKITHLLMDEAFLTSPHYGIEPEFQPVWESFLRKCTLLKRDRNFVLCRLPARA